MSLSIDFLNVQSNYGRFDDDACKKEAKIVLEQFYRFEKSFKKKYDYDDVMIEKMHCKEMYFHKSTLDMCATLLKTREVDGKKELKKVTSIYIISKTINRDIEQGSFNYKFSYYFSNDKYLDSQKNVLT